MSVPGDPATAVDGARIAARLDTLWDVARAPGGGADRPAWSPAEAAAMRLVAGWAADAGLEPALDAHGNLWALPPGGGPVATSGSHVDTVPAGGRHDGALGTVLALEAAAALDGRVGVLTCAAEEAPRFAAGTLGSRLLTGALDEAALADLRDAAGTTAAEARAAFLRELDDLPRLPGPPPLARLRAHRPPGPRPRGPKGPAPGAGRGGGAARRGGALRPPAPPRADGHGRGGPRGGGCDGRPPRRARRRGRDRARARGRGP